MMAAARRAYTTADLNFRSEGSGKRDHILMMYDAAIDAIRLAREHAIREEKRAASASTSRALTILSGLRETLDLGNGGSVAAHLNDFYQFLMRRLVRAGGGSSTDDLAECEDLLSQVREAWAAISPQTTGEVKRRMFALNS